jgi:hypothetical protein
MCGLHFSFALKRRRSLMTGLLAACFKQLETACPVRSAASSKKVISAGELRLLVFDNFGLVFSICRIGYY